MTTHHSLALRTIALALIACSALAVLRVNAIPPAILGGQVFFDSDSSDVKQSAKETLRYYVPIIRQFSDPCRRVRVIGHLDRAEQKRGKTGTLDRQRATKVRDVLVDLGMTEMTLVVSGAGIDSLLVPQAPDDEPQNRRVELDWDCRR